MNDIMDNKNLMMLAIISIVAISGMVVMAVVFNANISGQIPKNIDTVPTPVSLISPVDGSIVSLTPTLDWTKTTKAEFIILYVDDEPGFSTPMIQEFQLRKNQRAFTLPAGTLESGKTYYWRVVTYNSAGAANSETFTFTAQ